MLIFITTIERNVYESKRIVRRYPVAAGPSSTLHTTNSIIVFVIATLLLYQAGAEALGSPLTGAMTQYESLSTDWRSAFAAVRATETEPVHAHPRVHLSGGEKLAHPGGNSDGPPSAGSESPVTLRPAPTGSAAALGAINRRPAFLEGTRTLRSVMEDVAAGVQVGSPITASDADHDALSFSLGGPDAVHFNVSQGSGQLFTRGSVDFEERSTYRVTVSVSDGMNNRGEDDRAVDGSIMVTVLVTDREETGMLAFSASRPRVNIPLVAVLFDPDGGVTNRVWLWERSADGIDWIPIRDAFSSVYTPTPEDEGYRLRLSVSYDDRRGTEKTVSSELDEPVTGVIHDTFNDVATTNVHAPAIKALARRGILFNTECSDRMFCPAEPVARWVMAVWLLRALNDEPVTVVPTSRFTDITSSKWWIRYVERLADRKITVGCDTDPLRYCPDQPVTRAQIASLFVRTLQLGPAEPAGFTDTDRSVHMASIDALFAVGITVGCHTDPLRYCPDQPVTRSQMASFLHRIAGDIVSRAEAAGLLVERTGWKEQVADVSLSVADLPADHPHRSAVLIVLERTVAIGCEPATVLFCPEAPLTYGESVSWLNRARGWNLSSYDSILRRLSVYGLVPEGTNKELIGRSEYMRWLDTLFPKGKTRTFPNGKTRTDSGQRDGSESEDDSRQPHYPGYDARCPQWEVHGHDAIPYTDSDLAGPFKFEQLEDNGNLVGHRHNPSGQDGTSFWIWELIKVDESGNSIYGSPESMNCPEHDHQS